MLSTRRIPTGPGRRPQSAKRQQFLKLIAKGWSIAAASREVGASRSAGNNWKNGYKVYRHGEVIKFIAALDQFAERPISPRFLSADERVEIADRRRGGETIRAIAESMNRSPSTISRELRRHARPDGQYRPFAAQRQAVLSRRRPRSSKLAADTALHSLVAGWLKQRWSPQQISRELRLRFPDNPAMWLCPESIYRAIYQPDSTLTRAPIVTAPRRSPLRTGRDHRKAHRRATQRRRRFIATMTSIHERPFAPEDRGQPGNWEGDLIVGPGHRSAIGTLVERTTRTVKLLHLERPDSATLHRAMVRDLAHLPAHALRSITWDQGTDMATHDKIARDLGVKVYFCDPASPWQRGSNENINGVLRDYFPKSTDLSVHSRADLKRIEGELNRRPRAVLGHRPPATLFEALLSSETHPLLQ